MVGCLNNHIIVSIFYLNKSGLLPKIEKKEDWSDNFSEAPTQPGQRDVCGLSTSANGSYDN
jgi:hypothetical protein